MVNIKARTQTLLFKVPVGWSNNLGKISSCYPKTFKENKKGKDALSVGNNSLKLYRAEA